MVKLDLHTHSENSYDALTTIAEFQAAFAAGKIDQVAITDHNEINFAKRVQRELGEDRIIVGEEVTTREKVHVIGLFITKFIPRGLSIERTCELIRNQNGLIYIPHPFAPNWGIGEEKLREIAKRGFADIVEGFNSWNRPLPIVGWKLRKSQNIQNWALAEELELSIASGTDTHTASSLGNAYSEVAEIATRQNLIKQLKALTPEQYKRDYNSVDFSVIKAGFKSLRSRRADR